MNNSYANFILSRFYDLTSAKVLELGVGSGENFCDLAVARNFSFVNYLGVDIDERSILVQQDKVYTQEARFKVFDFSKLITKSSVTFNLIIDSHLLHCLITKEQQLNYLKNICKNLDPNNGVAFFEVMVESKNFEKKYQSYMNERIFNEAGQARYFFNTYELESLLTSAGFVIEYFCVESKFQFHLNDVFDTCIDLVRAQVRVRP